MVKRARVEWRCYRGALPLQVAACCTDDAQEEVVRLCKPRVVAANPQP
jgi:hypothetical protein